MVAAVLAVALLASVSWIFFQQQELNRLRPEHAALLAKFAEADEARTELEVMKNQRPAKTGGNAEEASRDLARLRNDVNQLRQQAKDSETQRAKSERELAQLRAKLGQAEQGLAEKNRDTAELAGMTPEQIAKAKSNAAFARCINNVKQIGLACRLYANEHGGVFPPDFTSLKKELVTPKILFCAAAPGVVPVATWEELDPKTISYQLLNPGGNERNPQVPLTSCTACGNYGLSDGSAYRAQKQ